MMASSPPSRFTLSLEPWMSISIHQEMVSSLRVSLSLGDFIRKGTSIESLPFQSVNRSVFSIGWIRLIPKRRPSSFVALSSTLVCQGLHQPICAKQGWSTNSSYCVRVTAPMVPQVRRTSRYSKITRRQYQPS